ncbi:MAG: PIG-L family deacetylase [Clostridiales bacterium]|nr:PIG-L family deacetylase [Clostridiales bacterium]
MKKLLTMLGILTVVFMVCLSDKVYADEATTVGGNIELSSGEDVSLITDNSYYTSIEMGGGTTITVTANSPIKGAYIVWGSPVNEWTLGLGEGGIKCGTNGFLHEYISFQDATKSFTMTMDSGNTITDITLYTDGELPSNVQVWKPECDKADIMLLSSHADDEILFFGGILPYYAGELDLEVQVVYFSQYWTGETIREHEKLDGLWHSGVKNYPYTADFDDIYADNLEEAKQIFGYEKTLDFVVEMIRKFKPQVAVAQDENGEYGHGTHMLTAAAMKEAVQISMDSSKYPNSADKYGVWDVPKTYLHLYGENQVILDCRTPLDSFGGKTTLEVAQESYKLHVSQQWCWYYVDDEYEYSCAKFGLYRSAVGVDTGNDLMKNLIDYKTQFKDEQERLERESIAAHEAELESESIAIAESIAVAEDIIETQKNNDRKQTVVFVIVIIVVIVVSLAGIYLIMLNRAANNRKKKRRNKK